MCERVITVAAVKDHYKQLVCESVVAYLAKRYALNKKEQQLLAYFLDDRPSPIIGDICRALKTTPRNLLSKTQPELFRKVGAPGSKAWETNIHAALESGDMPELVTSRRIKFIRGKRA